MYNLFVSGDPEAWRGEPFQIEEGRFWEYTDRAFEAQFGSFNAQAVEQLRSYPCIFAHEAAREIDPKFGLIVDVARRQGQLRVHYEVHDVQPFLTHEQLSRLKFEMDIGKWELNRTHWAVKDVELATELHRQGIQLPPWARPRGAVVDITSHRFDVALSFPGEARALAEEVAGRLEGLLGPHRCFYDRNYTAQLARPSLDTLLQAIYRERSKLIVIFIGADYQRKEWCGLELRAIREIIQQRGYDRIMLVRLDDGAVEGIFNTDGYIDARAHHAADIAGFIQERASLLAHL